MKGIQKSGKALSLSEEEIEEEEWRESGTSQ